MPGYPRKVATLDLNGRNTDIGGEPDPQKVAQAASRRSTNLPCPMDPFDRDEDAPLSRAGNDIVTYFSEAEAEEEEE